MGDMENLDNIGSDDIRRMKLAQLEQEKNSMTEKLRVTGKRIDHLERAFRKEEAKKLPEDYASQREKDLAAYEKTKEQTLKDAKAKHQESVELKHRLSRLVSHYESYRETIVERRHDEFEKRRRDAQRELEKAVALRKKEFRERKAREKREIAEQERILREEERQEALEMAALQARRAEEAEKRRAEAKAAPRGPPPAMERTGSSGAVRPPLPLAGAKLGWREKEKLR